MPKKWINHYIDEKGEWRRGQAEYLKSSKIVDLGDSPVRIYETSRSGVAVLSPVDERLTSYGDAEVYLKIFYVDGRTEYLSAPLQTPIDLFNVSQIELNILYLVGNAACDRIIYRAMVNAHCVYEIIEGAGVPIVDQHNLVPQGNVVVDNQQSAGQVFTVSCTGQLVGIEVAVVRCQATETDVLTLEVGQGVASFGSASIRGALFPGPGLCGVVPAPLNLTVNGPGYFDLRSLNKTVVAGQSYFFKLSNPASRDFRIGMTANVYAGGTALVNDNPTNTDLAFKILIVP